MKTTIPVSVEQVSALRSQVIPIELTVEEITEARAYCPRCITTWVARSNTILFGKTPEEHVMAKAARHRCEERFI